MRYLKMQLLKTYTKLPYVLKFRAKQKGPEGDPFLESRM